MKLEELNNKKITVKAYGKTNHCTIAVLRYANKRPAIRLEIETELGIETYAIATVNLPDYELLENHFHMKFWSGNEHLRQPLIDTGFFVDTGERVSTQFTQAELWRLKQ